MKIISYFFLLLGIINPAIAQRSASSVGIGGYSPAYNSAEQNADPAISSKTPIEPSKDISIHGEIADKSMSDAKQKCLDLGFKVSTEQFGKCVLRISK